MKRLFLFTMLFISVATMNAQLARHGLVLNGGIGRVDVGNNYIPNQYWGTINYKASVAAGYRFRFVKPAPQSFHYDLDMNVGIKYSKPELNKVYETEIPGYSGFNFYYMNRYDCYVSISGTANFSIIKNLSIGLGFEPTFFVKQSIRSGQNRSADDIIVQEELMDGNRKFDIPVIAKIAYDFKAVEVGISGKYGLVNVFESPYIKSGKFREIQLSLFIPF